MSFNPLEHSLRNLALAFIAGAHPAGREGDPESASDLQPGAAPHFEQEALLLHATLDRFGGREQLKSSLERLLQAPLERDVRLVQLRAEFDISDAEVLACALCAAVDDDLWTGRLVAYTQRGIGGSRPLLGMLADALAPAAQSGRLTACEFAEGVAFRSGLLTFHSEAEPLPERAVGMPLPVARALAGHETPWPGRILPPSDEIKLPESHRSGAAKYAAMLRGEKRPVVIVRSASREDAFRVAREIVTEFLTSEAGGQMNGAAVFLEADAPLTGLAVWLRLRGRVPVFVFDTTPGETKHVPWIPDHSGPVLAVSGPDGGVAANWREEVEWALPFPTVAEREELWKTANLSSEDAAELARTHRQGAARIAQVGRLAKLRAGTNRPSLGNVREACRSGEGTGISALAQLMAADVSDEAFIRPPELEAQLDSLLARCRLREGLSAALGPSALARYSPGVRTLFTGPSGTGKTLAAGWLATRLGLPLYRVDLAAISSKYIGETERNLSQLLAAAEHTAAVLLFDEADSLFGKRTDIRDSVDRFANAQTNYLLQRIETFEGIAVLTSNSRAHFDAAFARRLDVVIEFPPPGFAERGKLWTSHVGKAALDEGELALLSAHAELPGGQIRNVVFAAAVEAGTKNEKLAFPHILGALTAEYRKNGRSLPEELTKRQKP